MKPGNIKAGLGGGRVKARKLTRQPKRADNPNPDGNRQERRAAAKLKRKGQYVSCTP